MPPQRDVHFLDTTRYDGVIMTTKPNKPASRAKRCTLPRLANEADPATFFTADDTAPGSFAEALATTGFAAAMPPAWAEKEAPLPPAPLGEQLKGYPPPQGELDCHGLTAAEAETTLHRFLSQAGQAALRTVRVITGKGRHSMNGPVLRDMVESELRLLKKSGAIVAFRWEKKEKERSGSIIVYL